LTGYAPFIGPLFLSFSWHSILQDINKSAYKPSLNVMSGGPEFKETKKTPRREMDPWLAWGDPGILSRAVIIVVPGE
jgi:hypothetical protein